MNNYDILAIIPARGGSKGLLKKNIKPLNKRPLIYYAISEAKKAGIKRIVVSTDNKEIEKAAVKYGSQTIIRPKKLAKDSTPMLPVIKHALSVLRKEKYSPDIVLVLQPTSPLRKASDIKKALKLLYVSKADSVISVTKLKKPIEWVLEKNNKGFLVNNSSKKIYARQQAKERYYPNGAIFVSWTESILKNNLLYGPKTTGYVMPEESSVDIDTELDFILAEKLLKGKK
ncbi:MAG: acylneuraminate cytidylyltransferase family protein [archaeon]|nr:acylneuraminate cytidylyltransferase family protein [archaeon]